VSLSGPVESIGDPRAQRIADLAKPGHKNTKVALIEDQEPLQNALRAGVRFIEVYYDDRHEPPSQLIEACAEAGAKIAAIDSSLAMRLFKTDKRPKLFGLALVPKPVPLAALVERAGDIVVLDGVRIVGNIGAIIRTASGLGAAGVVLIDSGLSSIADRRLLRASRGYVFSLPVIVTTAGDFQAFVDRHKLACVVLEADTRGQPTALTASASVGSPASPSVAAKPTSLADLAAAPGRKALVFGSERTGASVQFRAGLPGPGTVTTVAIPMPGPVESLNVSVAVGIALYARLQAG
jgi:TrmH family RNA methyltransferase